MPCVLSNGLALGCNDNQGGIQEVYIGNYNKSLGYTIGTGASASIITAFTGATAASTFYTFEQKRQTATWTEKITKNADSGVTQYEQTCIIQIQGINGQIQDRIRILNQGNFRIIILDKNGRYWLLGKQSGLETSESASGVGKMGTDQVGAIITFMGYESMPAYEVTAAAAAAVITP